MKNVIVYYSHHHGNTRKLLDAIAAQCDIQLIDAEKVQEADLTEYDLIGFASGIYYSKFHPSVAEFAKKCLPEGKRVFLIATFGGMARMGNIEEVIREKHCTTVGCYTCKGWDTFGPLKVIGGLCKEHPSDREIQDAVAFYRNLSEK